MAYRRPEPVLAEDGETVQLAVCFPAEGELAGLQKKIPLREFKTDHTGGPYREKKCLYMVSVRI